MHIIKNCKQRQNIMPYKSKIVTFCTLNMNLLGLFNLTYFLNKNKHVCTLNHHTCTFKSYYHQTFTHRSFSSLDTTSIENQFFLLKEIILNQYLILKQQFWDYLDIHKLVVNALVFTINLFVLSFKTTFSNYIEIF